MEELGKQNREKLIDLLTERLVFERSGVKLYDRLLDAVRASNDDNLMRTLGELQEYRDAEKAHEEWLEEQIRNLGGDAHGETNLSKLVTRESKGIEEVMQSDPDITHMFHALLAAELVDNAGWDLLVQLADEVGDRHAKREFKKRLHEEEEHLLYIRKAMERLSIGGLTGETPKMPGGIIDSLIG